MIYFYLFVLFYSMVFSEKMTWGPIKSSFFLRGDNYFQTKKEIECQQTITQLMEVEVIRKDISVDNLLGNDKRLKSFQIKDDQFLIAFNAQIPPLKRNIISYYKINKSLIKSNQLLQKFLFPNETCSNRASLITTDVKMYNVPWGISLLMPSNLRRDLNPEITTCYYNQQKNYLELDMRIDKLNTVGTILSAASKLGSFNMEFDWIFFFGIKDEKNAFYLPEKILAGFHLNDQS